MKKRRPRAVVSRTVPARSSNWAPRGFGTVSVENDAATWVVWLARGWGQHLTNPGVLLGGAATVGDLRGLGVYTSLVARRLADARAAGAGAAVIQAVRGTSAPVCAKLGFEEMLPLEFYAWVPPGVEMDLHA